MICPACGYENLQGDDECANCGADLRTADIPAPSNPIEEKLVAAPLSVLRPPRPVSVAPSTTAAEAVGLMRDSAIGCLLVEDRGRLVGIVSERDCALKLSDGDIERRSVADLMTTDPVVLRHDDSLAVAIHKMAVGGFRHIPLIEDGRPTGIVSARDIFGYILRLLD